MIGLFLPKRADDGSNRDPLSNFWYGPVGRAAASGVTVTQEIALTYSAVWAATRLLSGTPGWLPLNLYRKTGARGKMIASDDPRNTLVETRPNPMMIPMLWKSQGFQQQINRGNAYYEIQRNRDGSIFALWPIHATRVRPKIATSVDPNIPDELYYEVKNNDGSKTEIPAADMLHFPSCISDDGICGKGVIEHARESIGMGLATERSGASFFGSGGIPRVVVESPKRWTDDSRKNFRKEWKEIYGGPEGDKIGLLDEGAKLHMLNISQQDSQFLETRQFNVEEIARWYGVPPHKLQQLLRATFSNIEHQSIEFVTDSLMPWLVIWEQELDAKLLTLKEQESMFFRFNVLALLRGDATTRSNYLKSLVSTAIITRNEARYEEDFNEAEGGDTFLVQGAMVALDADGNPMPSATASPGDTFGAFGPAADEPPVDETPKDEPPADNSASVAKAALIQAAKQMLHGSLSSRFTREAEAARFAAKKPKEFLAWIDGFYPKHAKSVAKSLETYSVGCLALGYSIDCEAVTTTIVEESQTALLDVAGVASNESLERLVNDLVSTWETDRATIVVGRIFQEKP